MALHSHSTSNQGSRPVEMFFRSVEIFFAGQISSPAVREFGRPAKKKQARHPGRWPRLDSAPSRFFFRGPRNFKPGGLEIWPAAGRSGSAYKGFPIGEPPAGLSAAKKKTSSALGLPGHAKKNLDGPAYHRPREKKTSSAPASRPLLHSAPVEIFFSRKIMLAGNLAQTLDPCTEHLSAWVQGHNAWAQGRNMWVQGRNAWVQGRNAWAQGRNAGD